MKIEEIIILVFCFSVSSYAIFFLVNLWKISKKILNQIDGNNILKIDAYQSYGKTIKQQSTINELKSFSRANQFITLESLLKFNGLNIRLYLAIPSLLVGLGVLGTFLGFSLTIWSIGEILDSSNQIDAMKNLFASVKIAFSSSVTGMFWSFIFSKYEKIQFHHLEEKINYRCNQLDELYYQSHDEYIRDFIGNFESSIATNIINSFTIINDTFKDKISDLLKEPTEALKVQSKNFGKQFNKWETSLTEQNKIVIASAAQLAALPTTIKNQINDITAAFTVLDKDIGITLGKLTYANNEVDTYINKWLNAIQLQANAIAQQEDSIHNINLLLTAIPNIARELDKVNKTFEKVVISFQKTEAVLTTGVTNISHSVNLINQAMTDIPHLNQAVKDIKSSVEIFNDDIVMEHKELHIIIDTLEKSIKTVFNGLDNTIEQRLTRTNNLLSAYFSAIDKLSEKIVTTYTSKNEQ
jgi:hypothetical protein